MNRYLLCAVATLVSLSLACGGGSSSPTSPSPASSPAPAPAPAPVATTLSGVVTITPGGARASNATIVILDGGNAGKTTTTDSTGSYRLTNLTPLNGNVAARGAGYGEDIKGLFINGAATQNFVLYVRLFSQSGTGDTVFDTPTTVARVRIQGVPSTSCQNFVVKIAGRIIVNVILGTCSSAVSRTFDGTYLTSGGVTEITISTGVSWTFTEVR